MAPLVLIVEDDPDIRDVLADVLSARGFAILAAANGREAFDVVHRAAVRPAAIVLDLMMPEMDGAEFLDAKACDLLLASVPTLIMTAQPAQAPAPLPATVAAVLTKPAPLAVLVELLRDLSAPSAAPRPVLAHGTGATAAAAITPRRRRASHHG